jgi:hypothetical protein
MKHQGIAMPRFVFRDGKLAPSARRVSVSQKIRQRKSKRIKLKRGKKLPPL